MSSIVGGVVDEPMCMSMCVSVQVRVCICMLFRYAASSGEACFVAGIERLGREVAACRRKRPGDSGVSATERRADAEGTCGRDAVRGKRLLCASRACKSRRVVSESSASDALRSGEGGGDGDW